MKGLKKESLRDNISTLELTLNQLAEATTTAISKKEKLNIFNENKQLQNVAAVLRVLRVKLLRLKQGAGYNLKKAVDFARLLTNVIDVKAERIRNDGFTNTLSFG